MLLPIEKCSTTYPEFVQDSDMTISQRLAEIEGKLEKVLNNQHKFMAERPTTVDLPLRLYFPINSFKELQQVDAAAKTDMEKFVNILKKIVQPDGLVTNLNKIIGGTIVSESNYDGVNGKKSFKHFKFLNKALLEACMKDGYTILDYIKEIRTAFRLYKNRLFKKQYDTRRKEKEYLSSISIESAT